MFSRLGCNREEENESKTETVQKAGFIKGPVFKGVASSRFLPKGTKTKVNLEEQGRQKVSFSFSLTKKTLPNRFLPGLGNEKQNETQNSPAVSLQTDFNPKIKMDLGDAAGSTEESSPPKPKVELGKIHFKKHLLSVTTKPPPPAAAATLLPPPPALAPVTEPVAAAADFPSAPPPPPTASPAAPMPVPTAAALPQLPVTLMSTLLLSPPVQAEVPASKEPCHVVPKEALELDPKQDVVSHGLEEHLTQHVAEQVEVTPQKEDSHIGKDDEVSDSSKGASLCSRKQSSKRKFSQSDGTLLGSESDEDSVRTSSSQRSHEQKISSAEKERDPRKSSSSLRGEELKSSSRSRSDRDEKYSSYSKSERDSRYSSSRSRSDRERRRSRSHSRSRSDRSSRTSSSYSRSERSHYYESERRYHRSSPYRERTRYSRSYADSRGRESSDSEDEYRRTHSRSSDSRRTSSHSSYRESRTSYSKSDRDSKVESSHADVERRGKSSKADRDSKRTSESEVTKRCSPLNELGYRKGTSHSKPDSNVNSSRYKSTPSKIPAPKPDKFKSSFCCTESVEEIKQQSNSLDLETSCLKSNEIRVSIAKRFEREKTLSPLNQLNDSPTFKKTDESKAAFPHSGSEELASNECHDSVKEQETLVRVKHEQLRTGFPIEMNINGSPEGSSDDLAAPSASKAEDVAVSSDDSLCRLEASHVGRTSNSYPLPSNGFESTYTPKEHEPDDSHVQSSECSSLFKEEEALVLEQQSEAMPLPVVNVDDSKISVNNLDDQAAPCDKTKEPVFCYVSDDATPSLYHSEVEIEVEPADVKVTSEPFLDLHVEPQTVTCDYESTEDPNSKSACEEEQYHVNPPHQAGLAVDSSSRDSAQDCSSPRIRQDCPVVTQHLEENVPSEGGGALPSCSGTGEVLELDVRHVDLNSAQGKLSLKDEHSYYSQVPLEHCSREEAAEEMAVTTERVGPDDLKEQDQGASAEDDGGNEPLVASAFPDASFPSCDVVVAAEEPEAVTQAPTCDSSGGTSEFAPAPHDDYSDTAESDSEPGSDDSDTEDTDSDDGVPRKRLQSVVVVPKNSSIAMEDSSPCSSRSSQGARRYSDHWDDERPEPSRPYYEERPEATASNNGLQAESRCSPRGMEKSPASSTELSRKDGEELRADACQPQSDGVDSTSQTDLAVDSQGKPNTDERMLNELMSIGRPLGRQEEQPFCVPESFESTNESCHQMSFSKPDSWQGSGGLHQSGLGDCSREDGFHSVEGMGGVSWELQAEKPSSTYQQPDSSFGVYSGYVYQPGTGAYSSSQNCWQGNGYWDARSAGRPAGGNYERVQGQVPDSLTEDHEEYEDDRWDDECKAGFPSPSSKFHAPGQKETGSVQAHEISSNSSKEPVSGTEKKEEVKALEKNDVKERGPPKKRRQELESDSESDADSRERKKVKVEGEQEVAPQDSSMVGRPCIMDDFRDPQRWKEFAKQGKMPCYFDLIEENVYLTERKKSKSHRDIKRMLCECPPLSKEERAQGEVACGEDCLNRLLMIECSSRCPNGDYCSNRRFQKKQHADVEVILTEKKGWGLRAAKDLPSNTFVLEYCGEVLDHKEFKARVKEYARNKNIHYYFMALKNDEIIDATQKGNCSRFMNHSCEPNCETQKWTVNGQLRVGFFTTKLVPSGSELTFDYQFQRYGKEAQKCFCGSANCRGYLGGENRVSIRAAGGKMKKERSRKKDSVDGELEALLENGEGLSDKNQVLSLSRLMVRIETLEQKLTCLKLIQNTHSQSCLKSFLECHGLSLLWIWMTELGDSRGSTANNLKLQLEIMKTLELLPIPTKNMLEESKVLPIIQRWAQTKSAIPQLSEGDGYSSENTSRAHTPLNTPELSAKQSAEGDTDTPKKLVFRRLKIISENSMDSAISDTTSELEGKEGKEDLDQLEVAPTEVSEEQQPQQEVKVAVDTPVESSKPQELEAEPEVEVKESNGTKLEEPITMETPSQDEEEGVSDVESERSQEQTDKIVDVSDLATRLLDCWKDLKEVYRIPKKSQAEKESSADRGREAAGLRDQTPTPKNPVLSRTDPEWQNLSKEKKRRRDSLSPPASAYERGTKRPEDRYDTPASKKKVRLKDRNKLSTEERRKLFEQEVAQREAQKQQQQLQNLGITSPLPYDSMGYGTPHHSFIGYPPGYPMQAYVDPSNPNAGKVLLPTPSMDSMCSPAAYEHPQPMVGHTVEPTLPTPQPVPVVQHVATPMEVTTPQYVAQSDAVVHQEPNVAVLPVPTTGPVQGQSYGVWDSIYKALLEDPMLKFSGLYQETCSDLYVTCQVFAEGKPLALPVRTSYKAFSTRWNWNEWLKLPVKYPDLPRNAQVALTIWDVYGPGKAVPVGGTTVSLFGKYGMFRQGMHDLKVWPNVEADGSEPTRTPGRTSSTVSEDQMSRLAKLTKSHRQGHMVKVDWLDRLTFREIEMINEREKRSSNFMYLMIEFRCVKSDDKEYGIVYYEKDGDESSPVLTSSEIVKIPDPQMSMENLVESKHHKLARSLRSGPSDHDLKPNAATRDQLNIIVSYPPTKQLTYEEQDLVWKFRYYLTNQEKALTKFLKCVNWDLPQEAKQALELLGKWKPMDVEDSLELLSSHFTNPTVRRYAVARLQQADDEDLLMYLLQLVQALKYENFDDIKNGLEPSKRDSQGSMSESMTTSGTNGTEIDSSQIMTPIPPVSSPPLTSKMKEPADNENLDQDLCTFLISRACKNSTLANYLYWYVIVECEDQDTQQRDPKTHEMYLNVMRRFSQALLKGDKSVRVMRSLLAAQQTFVDRLVHVMKAVQRESGNRKKKNERLQALLADNEKMNLAEMELIPLPLEPQVKIKGIIPEKATLFKSALMPAQLFFKTEDGGKYPVIFKHGDDLRQDQLILQIISLMDKLLRKENLDLKLTPYKVLATSTKHGFMQFIQSVPVAEVLATEESIQNFFRKHAPSETGPHGISAEVMDTYVKSCAGYCVITYILGVGDRHLDNLLLTKTGKLFHIDFGYILGRDPKPLPPPMKLNKEMVEGMGGTQSEQYQEFRKQCYTAFLHLRRYSNLILNLFSLMVDANIPDIALEPDKTVKKVQDKFRLDLSDEEAVHYMQSLIDESVHALFAAVVEQIHKFAQYWRK